MVFKTDTGVNQMVERGYQFYSILAHKCCTNMNYVHIQSIVGIGFYIVKAIFVNN